MSDLNLLRRLLSKENFDGNRMLHFPGATVLGASKASLSAELALLKLHRRTTKSAGKETLGLDSLISSLEPGPDNVILTKIDFQNDEWHGYFLATEDESILLGFALVRINKETPLRTPPNWDGSLESLSKFNK